MKGDKLFKRAESISDKLYNDKLKLSLDEKIRLYSEYILLIRKSAYLGNALAQFELALHYEEVNFFGLNPSYNKEKCKFWYSKSCNSNFAEACNNLAIILEREKKFTIAKKLYKKAINLGSKTAINNYKDE